MRKVIPYIASQYRKDKIWLRRTKKSKRQYQILLAIDDSSSMSDNQSKQVSVTLNYAKVPLLSDLRYMIRKICKVHAKQKSLFLTKKTLEAGLKSWDVAHKVSTVVFFISKKSQAEPGVCGFM